MVQESNGSSERERQVNEIITAYLQAVDAGQTPDRQEWLRQYPEFAAELEAFLAEYAWMNPTAKPLPLDAGAPALAESVVSAAAAEEPSDKLPSAACGTPPDGREAGGEGQPEPARRWHGWTLIVAGLIAMALISVVIGAVVSEFLSERGWANKRQVARRADTHTNSWAAAADPHADNWRGAAEKQANENMQRARQAESRAAAGSTNAGKLISTNLPAVSEPLHSIAWQDERQGRANCYNGLFQ